MKKYFVFIGLALSLVQLSIAQDEGTIVKRERIQRDKNIFVGGGLSIPGESGFSDYSNGLNFEGGFSKRVNRIISIGGSFSYLSFKYNPETLAGKPTSTQLPNNFYYGFDNSVGANVGYLIGLAGGNLTLLSISGNLKINFVPIKENTVISIYGFAKPFIAYAKHSDMTANIDGYLFTQNNWNYVASNSGDFKIDGKITGGIFVGPGIEINPTKPISFFLQASFGYTFPTEIINTQSFPKNLTTVSDESAFPFKSTGFTSINFAGGISFNLD